MRDAMRRAALCRATTPRRPARRPASAWQAASGSVCVCERLRVRVRVRLRVRLRVRVRVRLRLRPRAAFVRAAFRQRDQALEAGSPPGL